MFSAGGLAAFAAGSLLCAASALWLDAPGMEFLGRHYLIYQQPLQISVYIFWAMLALPATALAVSAARLAVRWRRLQPTGDHGLGRACLLLASAGASDLLVAATGRRSGVQASFFSPPRYEFAFFQGDFASTFPSGHAAMAGSLLMVLWHFYPRWRWLSAAYGAALIASLVVARATISCRTFWQARCWA